MILIAFLQQWRHESPSILRYTYITCLIRGLTRSSVPILKHSDAVYFPANIYVVRIDNSTFERMEEFKHLGTTLSNQNSIAEEIKSRLRSGSACYHSVRNLLSSRLLSKNLNIKIYRTIMLPVVLYGCETWSLTLREERKLRVFENLMLRRIFGHMRDEVTGEWRRLHNKELNDLYSHPILCW